MTFHNEYVPKLEDETSGFLSQARKALNFGHSVYDMWTVDRENDMVLARTGRGHDADSANDEYWRFMDRKGVYAFSTTLLRSSAISDGVVHIERSIGFRALEGVDDQPDEASIVQIKHALEEFKDYCVLSKFRECELILKTADGELL
jgi:hypothetical protein